MMKIWSASCFKFGKNIRNIDFHLVNNSIVNRNLLSMAFLYPDGIPIINELVPDYVFFSLKDLKSSYKAKTPDFVMISGGIWLISERLKNILDMFDMGVNQIFEVPVYEYDQQTRYPDRRFILHISAYKDTLIPEKSKGIEKVAPDSEFWRPLTDDDMLVVYANAAKGTDLWIDVKLRSRIFWSNRLYEKIEAEKIQISKNAFRLCTVNI